MTGKTVTVFDLFLAKQIEMEASLRATRTVVEHPGEKGAASELRWRTMFDHYLPKRYSVRTGFVVDHKGDRSGQIDVIIHDQQYSPLVFQAGELCYVPAESVYAVFDSKQTINRGSVRSTGDKVASVRRLDRTSGDIYTLQGRRPGKPPEDQKIIGGILAYSCGWKDPFGDAFSRAVGDLTDDQRLNVGCAVANGGFSLPPDSAMDDLRVWDEDVALVRFFMAFVQQLQALGNALVMDLDEWSHDR